MPYAIKFQHNDNQVGYVTTEREEFHAILRGFQLLIPEFGDEWSRNEEALTEIQSLDLEGIKKFSYNTDPSQYRSHLRFSAINEISLEEYRTISKHAEILNVYA